METNYTKRSEYSSSTITLAVLTAVFGIICQLVADIFIPAVSAMLAVLYLSERGKRKKLFLLVSLALIAVNVGIVLVAAFTGFFAYSVSSLHVVALALLLSASFSRSRGKSETVAILTLTSIFFFAVSLWLIAFSYTGSLSLVGAVDFYKGAISSLKDEILLALDQASSGLTSGALADMYSQEAVVSVVDGFVRLLPAFIILLAILYTGIMCKVFSFAVYKTTGNPRIYEWRLMLTSVFAYFYCAIFLAFVFLSGISATFYLIIANLFAVFMPIFAYFGFGFATALLSLRYTRGFAWSVLIVLLILFGALAFVILSFFGVVFVILHNKHTSAMRNGRL